jgi:hypothetical protein
MHESDNSEMDLLNTSLTWGALMCSTEYY